MERICTQLLSAVLNGSQSSWESLAEKIKEWNLSVFDVVEDANDLLDDGECPNVNQLMYEAYSLHAEDVKGYIKEVVDILKGSCDKVSFDEWYLRGHDVSIVVDIMTNEYNDTYNFWEAKNIHELMGTYSKEVIEFLVKEEVVEVEDICSNKGKNCDEIKASIKFLQSLYEEKGLKK